MQRMVSSILRQYGTPMTITGPGGTREVRGFFQPARSKSLQSIVNQATPLGEISRGQYIYIGPAQVAVSEGETLTLGQKNYRLRRVEQYYYGSEAVYTWGLCIEKGVNDTWGSQS